MIQPPSALLERTVPGLHDAVLAFVLPRFPATCRILDCGAGSGAWVERLGAAGYMSVCAIDCCRDGYAGSAPFAEIDLNSDFAGPVQATFDRPSFDLITAIEVLEHLENPSHFLRQCRSLLTSGGALLITSPNPECAPARLRFLATGQLRHFDSHGDPTHITPVFSSVFRRLAATAGYHVESIQPVPTSWSFSGTHHWKRLLSGVFGRLVSGCVRGDCNLFLLSQAR